MSGAAGQGDARAGSGSPQFDERGLPAGFLLKEDLEIAPRDAHAALRDAKRGAMLLDCRSQEEFDTASVAGSTLIPLPELGQRLDELEDVLDERGGKEVLVICHSGRRSLKATLLLRQAGFENVRSVAGGIDLWSLAVDASVPRYDKSSGRCVVISK